MRGVSLVRLQTLGLSGYSGEKMSDNYREKQKPLKDQLKQETRHRIIQAGVKAFAEFGYHGMKIAAVARDAGVANGTFYLHFKDKQALFVDIVRAAVAKLASSIFAAHNYNGSSGNSDRAEIEVAIEFAERNRNLMRIALDSSAPELAEQPDIFAPLIDIRIRELKQGINEGHINPRINPEIGARAEIGMMMSVIQWWLNNRDKAGREEVIETLTQLRRSWAVTDSKVDDIDSLLSQWDSRL